MSFAIRKDSRGAVVILTLSGELEMAAAPELREQVDAVLALGGRHVLIDLAGLTFCDSAGLNAFVYGDRRCAALGGWLRLTGARGHVARVIELSGVDEIMVYRAERDEPRATA